MRRLCCVVVAFGSVALVGACAATRGGSDSDEAAAGTPGTGGSGDSTVSNGSSQSGTPCAAAPESDGDQDGFTGAAGDCNDCDANVNPSAVEVVDGMGGDENCDGQVDERTVCDAGIGIADTDPRKAAAAIDLCDDAASNGWGLVNARFLRAGGQTAQPGLQAGIVDRFGPNVPPRLGERMLSLSSGHARALGQPNPCGSLTCYMSGPGTPPGGFPQDVPNCPGAANINDDVSLEVEVRAPSNATGYSFDFTFYTFEYPEWVCSEFNDQFIALVNPAPAGAINGNISFDNMTNPVSVNIVLFEVCPGCPQGTAALQGTGFDAWNDAGATGWLVTKAPVSPGESISIRFAIWDTGDQELDSTVLIDNFQWLAEGGGVSVGTQPVPE